MASKQDNKAISVTEAKRLLADLASAPALILAVSGGPDSTAMLWLAARWRKPLRKGPKLLAVTVDHGLRPESGREAREVKRLAASLDIEHRTLRWRGDKPKTGIPAAARDARYALLAKAALNIGASHILTAHTRDDQAETILMRVSRGSGIAGLAAMTRVSMRDDLLLLRPLLGVSKARLIATLDAAKIAYADDPSNRDKAYARPRLRALLPMLAAEGIDTPNLLRLSSRLARANAAIETVVDHAVNVLVAIEAKPARWTLRAESFARLPAEVRLRLLLRAINAAGHEGPAELGKTEMLSDGLDHTLLDLPNARFKRHLAGAIVALARGSLTISPAPSRRPRLTNVKKP